MKLRTVLSRRRGRSSSARLHRILAAAITRDDVIILAFVTKVVLCKNIGLTHEQCFIAPSGDLPRAIARTAKQLGVVLTGCRAYFRT
jgi:hypothetical protein